jgi:DNA-binding NtrC family response regulator
MRWISERVRASKPALAAGAVLLAAIPAALAGKRLGRLALEYHDALWPAVRAALDAASGWIGEGAAGLLGLGLGIARSQLELCESPGMRSVRDIVQRAGRSDATVVLIGESGVGKEVVARALHEASPRRTGPFIKVNCAAIPSELLESEFFGHEKGAFTNAHARSHGHFERAHDGTLFLDEVGELSLDLQAKLLGALQDGEFYRVGGERVRVNVRVIAASARDLHEAVQAGDFRDDLYYRLCVVELRIPPLRERRDDIPALVEHFQDRCARDYGRRPAVSAETLALFQQHPWPGNVRELETMLRRIAILGSEDAVREQLRAGFDGAGSSLRAATDALADTGADGLVNLKAIAREAARSAERSTILAVLAEVQWNRTKAAQLLGISYRGLLYKLADLGLAREKPAA